MSPESPPMQNVFHANAVVLVHRSWLCRLVGCKLVIVRAVFPYADQWFARCDRKSCDVRTVTINGSPWSEF